MTTKRGKYAYVSPFVEQELDNIKKEEDIDSTAEAFRKMAKNSMVARMMKGEEKLQFSRDVEMPKFKRLRF